MGAFEPRPDVTPIDLAKEPEFDLGGLRVKPAERAVVMDGERRDVQPRVMQVLVALAGARPGVVSRDSLVERCWNGRIVGDDALNRCILALRNLAQEFTPAPFSIETVPRIGHRLVEARTERSAVAMRPAGPMAWRFLAIGAAILLAAAAGLFAWQQRSSGMPTVLVTAAANDAASRELARDLAVKLGSLETARSTSMRLISDAEGSSEQSDLILEVGRIASPAAVGASVALKAAPDRAILWSKEFEQPSRNTADLKQQIAFTVAGVLGCAAEASNPNGEELRQQTLKLYLNGCAALANLVGREAESVIPMFRGVLRDAPRFEGAWSRLLAADSDVFEHTGSITARNRLKSDVTAARKVNPNLAAVHLAEIILLPGNSYAEKMRLADRAVDLNPDNAGAYATRAQVLQLVGLMKDSVVDARRAMQLDPLSPGARNSYILSLAHAGLFETALQELREAERLWPGASSVSSTRFAFNLRYGDPRQAWSYIRSNPSADWMNAQSYLEARIDRTPAKIERAVQDAQRLYRRWPPSIQQLIQVYGEFNLEKDVLELLLRAPEADVGHVDLTFRPPTVDFWHDPRALLVAKRAGLLDYWRTSGKWPDFCLAPDLPYECKAEAAKIAR